MKMERKFHQKSCVQQGWNIMSFHCESFEITSTKNSHSKAKETRDEILEEEKASEAYSEPHQTFQ
jgi:hypothetical protein